MVNNASGPDVRHDEPLEYWADNFPTDVFGTMHGTRLAIDALRRSSGAIVNMPSIDGLWHGRRNPVPGYDLAKAAIIRLTTMLAWLGEKENIRVNCLAPGWIASEQVRSYWESLTPEQRGERRVPSRLLALEDRGGRVSFGDRRFARRARAGVVVRGFARSDSLGRSRLRGAHGLPSLTEAARRLGATNR